MSRLSIELTQEQHNAIKAMALLEGMSIKDFVVERVFEQKTKAKKSSKARAKKPNSTNNNCPLCKLHGGKNRKFNKATEQAIKKSANEKNSKRYPSAAELFRDLGLN